MNKWRIVFVLLIPGLLFPIAKEGEDLQTIEQMIHSFERQLVMYQELHKLMVDFQKQQDQFYTGPQTKELAIQMVQTASHILNLTEKNHLTHLFTPFFIEELKLFSGISKKKTP